MAGPMKIGISACLLGETVRYDGGHRRDPFIIEILGRFAAFVPICPEVECGLGVPRETMHLIGDPRQPRLVTTRSRVDHTERLLSWGAAKVRELEKEGVCGFIFKSRSPSCGVERVEVHTEGRGVRKAGAGLFAGEVMRCFPLLPVVEDEGLHDPLLRENFIERLFTAQRLMARTAENPSAGGDQNSR